MKLENPPMVPVVLVMLVLLILMFLMFFIYVIKRHSETDTIRIHRNSPGRQRHNRQQKQQQLQLQQKQQEAQTQQIVLTDQKPLPGKSALIENSLSLRHFTNSIIIIINCLIN